MGYEGHMFYHRPQCDYPGCGKPLDTGGGRNVEWFYDLDALTEAVEGTHDEYITLKDGDGNEIGAVRTSNHVGVNLVLFDAEGNPRFFCPDHIATRDGRHVGYNERYEETRPCSPELAGYYRDESQPLPKPECEQSMLDVLAAPVAQTGADCGDAHGMIPVGELTGLLGRLDECVTRFTDESEACYDTDRARSGHMAGCAQMARSTIEYLNGILRRAGE